jgi:hypothetical protein
LWVTILEGKVLEKVKRELAVIKRKVRKVKEKSTFLEDPFQSALVHLGHFIDNAKPMDWVDAALYVSLAYLGYEALVTHTQDPDTKEVTTNHYWQSLIVGPVGLKLATTMGGTPPVSQAAGLAILATLGVVGLGGGSGTTPSETAIIGQLPIMWGAIGK